MKRRIHVGINPASGRPKPILQTPNRVFDQAGVDWDISLNKRRGDAERFAREAAAGGAYIVVVYGGDGASSQTDIKVVEYMEGSITLH